MNSVICDWLPSIASDSLQILSLIQPTSGLGTGVQGTAPAGDAQSGQARPAGVSPGVRFWWLAGWGQLCASPPPGLPEALSWVDAHTPPSPSPRPA